MNIKRVRHIKMVGIILLIATLVSNSAWASNRPIPAEINRLSSENISDDIALVGTSVFLSDKLDLIFYYNLSESEVIMGNIYAKVTYENGRTENLLFDKSITIEKDGINAYGIECKVSAKEIGDLLSIQLWDKENDCPCSVAKEYSVAMYCNNLANNYNGQYPEEKLIEALLVYGACSQLYFDYKVDSLVSDTSGYNSSPSEKELEEIRTNAQMRFDGELPDGVRYHGCSLLLNSSIDYRLYFEVDSQDVADSFGMRKSNQEGLFFIEFTTISITQLGAQFSYRMGNTTVITTPLFFLREVLERAEIYGDEVVNLVRAIYDYYKAAVEYGEEKLELSPITKDIREAEVGSIIKFGTYEQDNNTLNGKEDIEWIVLGKTDNRILAISKYILDYQSFHGFTSSVSWGTSDIRAWLNGIFANDAFSLNELNYIPVVLNKDRYLSTGGYVVNSETYDQIFLLSYSEISTLLPTDAQRVCTPTKYAIDQGGSSPAYWWLRTPDRMITQQNVNVVTVRTVANNGMLENYQGTAIRSNPQSKYGIRPVIWIDTSN